MTDLAPHRRGDTFGTASAPRTFTLAVGLTGSTFTAGVRWTLRSKVSGDDGFVDQASSVEGEGGEITFSGEGTDEDPCVGSIKIPASRTEGWPARDLYWDLEGRIAGVGEGAEDEVVTLDSGELPVLPDITRGPGVDS
jgi:hypothetical protein